MHILFFSPHAFFDVHTLPELLVAESLAVNGSAVTVVTCDGTFSDHCLCHAHVPYEDAVAKNQICGKCRSHCKTNAEMFDFNFVSVSSYLTSEDYREVAAVLESVDVKSAQQLIFRGRPVGQFSLYEFILNHKLSSLDVPLRLWPEWKAIIKNCMYMTVVSEKIIASVNPDRVCLYNAYYSINRVVVSAMDEHSIPVFSLHAGSHLAKRTEFMTIFKGLDPYQLVSRHPVVKQNRIVPCDESQVDSIKKHIDQMIQAKSPWVYSSRGSRHSATDLRKLFSIDGAQSVLLVVMRSEDERFAAEVCGVDVFTRGAVFESQEEWLCWLISFAEEHEHFKFIIRLHPREFPNKRESVCSSRGQELIAFIENCECGHNVVFNKPSDNVSIYDLFKVADVCLNSTSTVGLEASLFGIPVVGMGDMVLSFDPALQKNPHDRAEYARLILDASSQGRSFDRIVQAFRWLRFLTEYVGISISDGYSPSEVRRVRRLYSRFYDNIFKSQNGLSLTSILPLKCRRGSLEHGDWLRYAIENDLDSHLGYRPLNGGDENIERDLIKMVATSYMRQISRVGDFPLLEKALL